MTLGPALIALSIFDRDLGRWSRPIIVFGRVPLFFYLLHIPLIHLLAVVFAYLPHDAAGKNHGCGLPGVYAVWFLVDFAPLSALPMVCRSETAPARRMAELFLTERGRFPALSEEDEGPPCQTAFFIYNRDLRLWQKAVTRWT